MDKNKKTLESQKIGKVYFDYNATTPVSKQVTENIAKCLEVAWGNPSSLYQEGFIAKNVINESRKNVASMISSLPNEIIFLSGGTEANNLVIRSCLTNYKNNLPQSNFLCDKLPHVIISNVEHDSVLIPLKYLKEKKEVALTEVGIENACEGILNSIRPTTCLISVMMANNETGVIFPISGISSLLIEVNKERLMSGLPKIFLHTDAAQAIGKIPVNLQDLNVDYLTIVGHKFYGPRIGALYVKNLGTNQSAPLHQNFFGGKQEMGYRPGTENTPMISGLAAACLLVSKNLKKYSNHMYDMKMYFWYGLKKRFGSNIKLNCVDDPCILTGDCEAGFQDSEIPNGEKKESKLNILPNTLSVAFNYSSLTGAEILGKCKSLMASMGSACHAGSETSSVLEKSGVCAFHARRTIRLSVGRETTKAEICTAIEDLYQAIHT